MLWLALWPLLACSPPTPSPPPVVDTGTDAASAVVIDTGTDPAR